MNISATYSNQHFEIRVGEDEGSAPNGGNGSNSRHGSVQGKPVLKDNGEEEHDSKQERPPLRPALRPRTAKTRRDEGHENQESTGDEGEKSGEAGAGERQEHQPLRFNLQIHNPHPPEEKKGDVEEPRRPSMGAKKGGNEDKHAEKSSPKVLSPRQDHKQSIPPSTRTNQKQPTPPPEKQRTSVKRSRGQGQFATEVKNPEDSRPKDHPESSQSERSSGDKNGSAATGATKERPTERKSEASRGRSRTRSARSTTTTGGAGQTRSRGASARSAASSRAQTPGRRPDSAFSDESGASRRPVTPLTGRLPIEEKTATGYVERNLQRLQQKLREEWREREREERRRLQRQRQYTPKICPSMSPYYVLEFSDYYQGNVAPEHEVPPYASRRTATGLVEPHVSLRMDRSNLGLEEFYASRSRASSRTTSARSRSSTRAGSARSRSSQKGEDESGKEATRDGADQSENEDEKKQNDKEHENKHENDEQENERQKGSTRLPKFPVFIRQPSRFDGREDITVADVHDIRHEINENYKTGGSRMEKRNYKHTKQDFYRMELDKLDEVRTPRNRKNMTEMYEAYLQNTEGTRRALIECLESLRQMHSRRAKSAKQTSSAKTTQSAQPKRNTKSGTSTKNTNSSANSNGTGAKSETGAQSGAPPGQESRSKAGPKSGKPEQERRTQDEHEAERMEQPSAQTAHPETGTHSDAEHRVQRSSMKTSNEKDSLGSGASENENAPQPSRQATPGRRRRRVRVKQEPVDTRQPQTGSGNSKSSAAPPSKPALKSGAKPARSGPPPSSAPHKSEQPRKAERGARPTSTSASQNSQQRRARSAKGNMTRGEQQQQQQNQSPTETSGSQSSLNKERERGRERDAGSDSMQKSDAKREKVHPETVAASDKHERAPHADQTSTSQSTSGPSLPSDGQTQAVHRESPEANEAGEGKPKPRPADNENGTGGQGIEKQAQGIVDHKADENKQPHIEVRSMSAILGSTAPTLPAGAHTSVPAYAQRSSPARNSRTRFRAHPGSSKTFSAKL